MAIKDLYDFEISGASGSINPKPVNSSLTWKWQEHPEEGFYNQSLDTALIFQGDDFHWLYSIIRARKICDKNELIINEKCDNSEFFRSKLSLVDGKYNVETCVAEITPRDGGPLSCLMNNWSREHNIVEIAPYKEIYNQEGVLERIECCHTETHRNLFDIIDPVTGKVMEELPSSAGCIDSQGLWAESKRVVTFKDASTMLRPFRVKITTCSEWVREKWVGEGAPDSPGWVNIDGAYYRQVETYESGRFDQNIEMPEGMDQNTLLIINFDTLDVIDHVQLLNDVLVGIINKNGCHYNVVSDFLGINPDGTAPNNEAYDYARNYLQELHIADIRALKENASPPTALEMSFLDIWRDIKTMFNLKMDMVDGALRIEHVSYFKRTYRIDLTRESLKKHLYGSGEFEYDQKELPRMETFEHAQEDPDGLWGPVKVEYEGDCVARDDSEDKIHATQKFVVNLSGAVRAMRASEDDENAPAYNDRAYVLISAKNDAIITSSIERRSPVATATFMRKNGPLNWINLFENLHTWGRYKKTGLVKRNPGDWGEMMIFHGNSYNRIQKDVQIPMCCEDILKFNPNDLIKTQFGWGKVIQATYESPAGILTLKLAHT